MRSFNVKSAAVLFPVLALIGLSVAACNGNPTPTPTSVPTITAPTVAIPVIPTSVPTTVSTAAPTAASTLAANSSVSTMASTTSAIASGTGSAVPATALPTQAATSAVGLSPSWLSLSFTDARTGQPITLASYAGKTVMVEAMAAWCTNCLAQQKQVVQVHQQLGDSVPIISLDVDSHEDATLLANYAKDKNFTWTFAIASGPLLDALVAQFGRTITNPPSTPIFIISPNGTVSELLTGGHTADDLLAQIKQHSTA